MKKLILSAFLVASVLFSTKSQAQIIVGARIGFGVPVPIPVPPHRAYYAQNPVIYDAQVPYYRSRPNYAPVYRRYVPNCYRERRYWRSGKRW